ncbi:MAG: FUSC family protein [Devosia sp.]
MEQLTRVDRAEDPHFAVRTALGVGLAITLGQVLNVSVPMLPAALALSLLSGQRGKFRIVRAVVPLAFPVLAWLFSYLAALTVSDPLLFLSLFLLLSFAGLYLMVYRGSPGGVLLIVFPALFSMTAIASDQVLVAMRDSMAMSGPTCVVVIVLVNMVFPTPSDRLHIPEPEPHQSSEVLLDLILRTGIFALVLIYCYGSADTNLIILPIIVAFVLGQSTHHMRRQEAIARISATVIGGTLALVILLCYRVMPQLPMLIGALVLATLFFTAKMFDGERSAVTYQFAGSVTIVIVMSSFASRDAIEIIAQRIALSTGAAVLAISLLALLEAIFLAPRQAMAASPD